MNEISDRMEELSGISRTLYENPELGDHEFKAVELLTDYFSKNGFTVEKGIHGLNTTFKAVCDSHKKGAHIALFYEYDALPRIGHGCGHNLISSMSAGAAMGLAAVLEETDGKISVFGTQAEESNGVKGVLADKGAFDDVTVAMMTHPNAVSEESGSSLALNAIRFEYFGKAAHAAAAPEKGINALDGIILLYNGINALRQHLKSDVRIHGILSNGGSVPNIVPDYAEAKFYFRAKEKEYLETAVARAKECAEGAAKMTGTAVKISNFERSYDNLKTNKTLSDLFTANLRELGETKINPPSDGVGSIDLGNVSQVVPSIHPWIGVGDPSLIIHSREFADHTMTEAGRTTLYRGACALARTGYDVITSRENQEKIKMEFASGLTK